MLGKKIDIRKICCILHISMRYKGIQHEYLVPTWSYWNKIIIIYRILQMFEICFQVFHYLFSNLHEFCEKFFIFYLTIYYMCVVCILSYKKVISRLKINPCFYCLKLFSLLYLFFFLIHDMTEVNIFLYAYLFFLVHTNFRKKG